MDGPNANHITWQLLRAIGDVGRPPATERDAELWRRGVIPADPRFGRVRSVIGEAFVPQRDARIAQWHVRHLPYAEAESLFLTGGDSGFVDAYYVDRKPAEARYEWLAGLVGKEIEFVELHQAMHTRPDGSTSGESLVRESRDEPRYSESASVEIEPATVPQKPRPASVSERKDAIARKLEDLVNAKIHKAGRRSVARVRWTGTEMKGYVLSVRATGFKDEAFPRGTLDEIEARVDRMVK
jgi:hypothetical protein